MAVTDTVRDEGSVPVNTEENVEETGTKEPELYESNDQAKSDNDVQEAPPVPHAIPLTLPQFRNIYLESWSNVAGKSGKFCGDINKKMKQLGFNPLEFDPWWAPPDQEKTLSSDEDFIKDVFGWLLVARQHVSPPPLPYLIQDCYNLK